MSIIGYARTSTKDQIAGLEDQVAELVATGCTKIFKEHGSGIDASRPELARALEYAREGDVFVVTKPDRLARSVPDLLRIVRALEARDIRVKVTAMGLDTSTSNGRFMLTVLAGVAEFERELMLERQRVGIAKAKTEGKYQGRKPTARAKSEEALHLHDGGMNPAQIARTLKIGRASVYRILQAKAETTTGITPNPVGNIRPSQLVVEHLVPAHQDDFKPYRDARQPKAWDNNTNAR